MVWRLGRIGVGDSGEVYIGPVTSKEYRIYTSQTAFTNSDLIGVGEGSKLSSSTSLNQSDSISTQSLQNYLTSFQNLICTGIMNKVFGNIRLLDYLVDLMGIDWVKEHIIPSLNIIYSSERNRVVGYKNIFNKGDTREVTAWKESDITLYTTGPLYILSKIALDATLDFILTSSTPERYKEIMERAKQEYERVRQYAKIVSTHRKKKRADIFSACEIASYWEHSVRVGEVFRAGVGQDTGLLVSRDRSKGIFTEVDDSRFYIINLYGFRNRLRFGSKVSIGALIELITQHRESYPLYYIHNKQSAAFQRACDIAHHNLTKQSKKKASQAEFIRNSREFIMAYKLLIDEVKSKLEAYIYEVTPDYMSFAIGSDEDVGHALEVIVTATNKYMPNMFEVLSLDANGLLPKYWEYSTINCIPLQLLTKAIQSDRGQFMGKTRLEEAIVFEQFKSLGIKLGGVVV